MRTKRNKFEDLKVWQIAHQLVIKIYKVTNTFPSTEKFRLSDQLCRSSASVAANIVEGNSRTSKKEFLQFINNAFGSLEETKYHLLLAQDLGYISEDKYTDLIEIAESIGKMLSSMRKYLKSKI